MTEKLDRIAEAGTCMHAWRIKSVIGTIFRCALCGVIGYRIIDPTAGKVEIIAQKCLVEGCERWAKFLDHAGWACAEHVEDAADVQVPPPPLFSILE